MEKLTKDANDTNESTEVSSNSRSSIPKNAINTSQTENQQDSTDEYVTGFKLVVIVASVAMACFLMLVDTMVIGTVRCVPQIDISI